jgi:hypothetical protein
MMHFIKLDPGFDVFSILNLILINPMQPYKKKKASAIEDARNFNENKFITTFESIWRHSIPSSHVLCFHYTSVKLGLSSRKSGLAAFKRFNGVPFTLRYPFKTNENDHAVFNNEEKTLPPSPGASPKILPPSPGALPNTPTHSTKSKFPHEQVLVLSLPKHLLELLPGFQEDEGLCMISSQALNAMRPNSFTAVVNPLPWLDGLSLLPPQCILRSFLLFKESEMDEDDSNVRSESSFSRSSSTMTGSFVMMEGDIAYVRDIPMKPISGIRNVGNIETYKEAMAPIRSLAESLELVPLFHYTSLDIAPLILKYGLRMSSQGQGDGGVYFSTLGPASYGLGTPLYEENIIKDCFGVERIEEYIGKGKLDVVIVYGCLASLLHQVSGRNQSVCCLLCPIYIF